MTDAGGNIPETNPIPAPNNNNNNNRPRTVVSIIINQSIHPPIDF